MISFIGGMFMFHCSDIIDHMDPYEFRFDRKKEFVESALPLTKCNEQYFVARQHDWKYECIHYYIIHEYSHVIGRFDVGTDLENCGITYHIVSKFQNRGIGQITLGVVVDDLFAQGFSNIRIIPINEKSAHIASKCGFVSQGKVYQLSRGKL